MIYDPARARAAVQKAAKATGNPMADAELKAQIKDELRAETKAKLHPWLMLGIGVALVVVITMGARWEGAAACKKYGFRPGSAACADLLR